MAYTATLKKLSENLKSTYDNTIFSHSGNIGDTREKVVIEYLKRVMAHKYGFQSGEVFDEDDVVSGQIDIIMYDNLFSTVFSDGSEKIVAPIESTYGIISVKSKMGTKELDNAIEGIKKYNSLKRPIVKENVLQIMPDFPLQFDGGLDNQIPQENINCIFAFDTTVATKTIIEKIKIAGCVDLLVIPDKFLIIGKHREDFSLQNEANSNFLEYIALNTENSVSLFILFLQTYLHKNKLKARNLENLILQMVDNSEKTTID